MIRAVIVDTWRQSRQQAVFIVMLVVMLVFLIGGIALPRPIIHASGDREFGTILSEQPVTFFANQWTEAYARTLLKGDAASRNSARMAIFADQKLTPAERTQKWREMQQEEERARNEAVARATDMPVYRRAVEYYVHLVVGWMFKITMLLFIAACAGYFPAMLGTGAVDIVLAKPLSRLRIYTARYIGGIALYAAAITGFCLLLYVGIGLRTGVFHFRIFYGIPLLLFIGSLLYALLALIGTASRSATMAMVVGYVFYVVVDSLVSLLLTAQPAFERFGWESVASVVKVLRNVLPNFGLMNDMALASLLHVPAFDVAPFAVALVWLLGSFGLGYWIFSKRDY
jgi:ABC-type transport system involved in multi-copper enzyme maturation permease subunit